MFNKLLIALSLATISLAHVQAHAQTIADLAQAQMKKQEEQQKPSLNVPVELSGAAAGGSARDLVKVMSKPSAPARIEPVYFLHAVVGRGESQYAEIVSGNRLFSRVKAGASFGSSTITRMIDGGIEVASQCGPSTTTAKPKNTPTCTATPKAVRVGQALN